MLFYSIRVAIIMPPTVALLSRYPEGMPEFLAGNRILSRSRLRNPPYGYPLRELSCPALGSDSDA